METTNEGEKLTHTQTTGSTLQRDRKGERERQCVIEIQKERKTGDELSKCKHNRNAI